MTVIGIDEAGRGPLAGPVVAGAVVLPPGFDSGGLTDSKKLSARARGHWYMRITAQAQWAVGVASVAEIEDLNILQATFLAMQRAVAGLAVDTAKAEIWIDGNQKPFISHISPQNIQCFVSGDALHPCISAASVVAKVTRDKIMQDLHAEYPHYGWHQNMGYGSAAHRTAITLHGATPQHRTLFLRKIYANPAIAA